METEKGRLIWSFRDGKIQGNGVKLIWSFGDRKMDFRDRKKIVLSI